MNEKRPVRTTQDGLAIEVDRLLKKLPHGESVLKADREADLAARAPRASVAAAPAEPSERAQHVGAWIRAGLAAGVGAALTQWPYSHDCGWRLYVYLGAVGTLLIAGGWAAIWAWRVRSVSAHILTQVVLFWGIVLSAEQVLPRIGYAAESAAWECRAP